MNYNIHGNMSLYKLREYAVGTFVRVRNLTRENKIINKMLDVEWVNIHVFLSTI